MTDVSRETPPAPSWVAGALPHGAVDALTPYADWLAGAAVERGLIGPREVPRLWERHLVNCAALEHWVPADATLCDIGTGAGLPGLVLALVRPDLRVTLVEPLLRRTTFLDEVTEALGLGDRVEVVRARAEELHGRRRFDAVTSRAVAPLERLLAWSMPLVAAHGEVVAQKGERAEAELATVRVEARRRGAGAMSVESVEAGPETVRVVRVAWAPGASLSWRVASGPARTPGRGRGAASGAPRKDRRGRAR